MISRREFLTILGGVAVGIASGLGVVHALKEDRPVKHNTERLKVIKESTPTYEESFIPKIWSEKLLDEWYESEGRSFYVSSPQPIQKIAWSEDHEPEIENIQPWKIWRTDRPSDISTYKLTRNDYVEQLGKVGKVNDELHELTRKQTGKMTKKELTDLLVDVGRMLDAQEVPQSNRWIRIPDWLEEKLRSGDKLWTYHEDHS